MVMNVTMKQLLESGVHFGHQRRRWNPKMARYIYTERNGIYIIDLKQTLKCLQDAMELVRDIVAAGGSLMFVGTKKQAKNSIYEAATRCGQFYVNNRWLGGMLTNFNTIRRSVLKLLDIDRMIDDGSISKFTKKETIEILREKERLEKNLLGIKYMESMPDILFVIDPQKEQIAINEARRLKIPIVAIVDTNCDPDRIDYVIPGNDDAIRAVKLFCDKVAEAAIEGLVVREEKARAEAEKAAAEAQEAEAAEAEKRAEQAEEAVESALEAGKAEDIVPAEVPEKAEEMIQPTQPPTEETPKTPQAAEQDIEQQPVAEPGEAMLRKESPAAEENASAVESNEIRKEGE